MGRPSTKTTVESVATVDETTVATNVTVEENMSKDMKENTKSRVSTEPLNDSDEIDVISLVPNVSYKDSKTGDMYMWDEVGHVEPMTFETLKNLWRNHKGYFRDMLLRPDDERVINKFGLTRTFDKYEFLMDKNNYNRKKIDEVLSVISETPNGLKYSIVTKIKDMVVTGELTDVSVIRKLEKHFDLDLISFLN